MRIDTDNYMMHHAVTASLRSTCPRARVGAIIALHSNILATGYNGSPTKTPHCEDDGVGCILDANGKCIRTIHAEVNALTKCVISAGATLYVTHLPCIACCHLIINLRLSRVVFQEFYVDQRVTQFGYSNQVEYLQHSNILVDHLVT